VVAAQINTLVGDIDGNSAKIVASAVIAKNKLNADVVVFPEMVITGYPPEDLLLRYELYQRVTLALAAIREKTKDLDLHLVVGYPTFDQILSTTEARRDICERGEQQLLQSVKPKCEEYNRYNAASVIYRGEIVATYYKQRLPNYGVFDEKRYFTTGTEPCVFSIKGVKVALTICEDLWFKETMDQVIKMQAQLVFSVNASPFDVNKPLLREQIMGERAREGRMPLLYVNSVGGQDELVFDGGSMVLDQSGTVTQRAAFFSEELMVVDFNLSDMNLCSDSYGVMVSATQQVLPLASIEDRTYQALVLGVRDYVNKNNFKGAIVSVSGGVDSALTLAIAVDALGKNLVETVYMPSRYSSTLSNSIVEQQAKILDVKLEIVSIEPMFESFLKSMTPMFMGLPKNNTEENLQARCRGVLLMAFSNQKNLMVLSTGNKSEIAVGYATLYGDMAGGFCVLKDVPKTLVYRLVQYRNNISYVIPHDVIRRIPSAELAPNQADTDILPPYPVLDAILERYIEQDQSGADIVAAGFAAEIVNKVIDMVKRNEYKRRQAPPGVRISAKAFGRDRRYPLTSGF